MLLLSLQRRVNGWHLRHLDAYFSEGGERRCVALKGPFALANEGPSAHDLVAEHLGLAQAWGLMYASDL